MSERPIGPCPVCGAPGFITKVPTDFVQCPACYLTLHVNAWNRLSRQAARVAELEGQMQAISNRLDAPDDWVAAGVQARAMARNALGKVCHE